MDRWRSLVELLLYLAVPIFVIAIGLWLTGRGGSRRILGAVSNRALGLAFVAVGGVDLVIRLLRATVLR